MNISKIEEIDKWLSKSIVSKWKAEPYITVINPITFMPDILRSAYSFENNAAAIMFKLKWGK